jgi:energy-coupling factor transporter ATP-binding protein EcfA2
VKERTYKDLPLEVQKLLTKKQKQEINRGICLGQAFLITGPQGSTGKTTLANALNDIGVRAVEPWDLVEITLSKFFVPKKER